MTTLDRFKAKVRELPSGCHAWTGAKSRDGYAKMTVGGKQVYAHRWIYGPVPAGLELDHLCRNRACVNREHLEAVSRSENHKRIPYEIKAALGKRQGVIRRARTHCPQGHEFTVANTWNDKNGHRHCRACNHERQLARRKAS